MEMCAEPIKTKKSGQFFQKSGLSPRQTQECPLLRPNLKILTKLTDSEKRNRLKTL